MIRLIRVYSFECDWLDCEEADEFQAPSMGPAIREAESKDWLVVSGKAFCPIHGGPQRKRQ